MLALLAVPAEASADKIWRWSYFNAGGVSASGTLTTGDAAAGAYPITKITGYWNGAAITGLEPPKSCCSPPGWNSNMLVEGDPKLDKGGFAFSASGGLMVNLFYKDGKYAYEIKGGAEKFGGVFVATPDAQ